MLFDVYKAEYPSDIQKRIFLLLPAGRDAQLVPEEVHKITGSLNLHRKIEIDAGQRHDFIDVDQALQDMEIKGFHLFEIDTALPEDQWKWQP